MKLNIIIPNYNGERTIEKCINSIYSQNISIKEVILVDDGSTDSSVEIVRKKYPKVRILKNRRNYGASYSRNKGIKLSHGNWVLLVDSDVYLSPFCIANMLKYAHNFELVYPTVFERRKIFSPSLGKEDYLRISTIFLIKKISLKKLDELFDENYFVYFDDVDFFLRCYLFGLKAKYAKDAIAYHLGEIAKSKKRLYLELRNAIYGVIKFHNIIPAEMKKQFGFPSIRKISGLIKTMSSRMLFPLIIKSIWWNFKNLQQTLKKRKMFQRKFNEFKSRTPS